MRIPATITEHITWGKTEEVSYRNLHTDLIVVNEQTDHNIKIPLNDYLGDYRFFMDKIILEVKMNDDEMVVYRCNPKALSLKLYGTTEYWYELLIINNCISKLDFVDKKIKVFLPDKIKGFTNEVMILEKLLSK
jgi:hypothetical protein|nr:MAG TPA: hypothetical protein [Caudoviricetes sp.]